MEYSVYIKQTSLGLVFLFWKEHFQEITTPPGKCEHRVLVKNMTLEPKTHLTFTPNIATH